MRKAADIFKRKVSHVETVDSGFTVVDALKLMTDKNFGPVAITQNGRFIGLITECNYSRKVVLKGRSSNEKIISEIMEITYPSVAEDDNIKHCMELISSKNLSYLNVIKN
jgi:CBS domain-containing protein